MATFNSHGGPIGLLPDARATILSPDPKIPPIGNLDPYSEHGIAELADEFEEAAQESVFEQERKTQEDDGTDR